MKYIVIFLCLAIAACGGSNEYKKAEDAQDAGREFIRATLDGDHEKARFYLLKDTTNLLLLKQQVANYDQQSSRDKNAFRQSSIRPVEIRAVNDSVTLFKYYNTFHSNDTTTLRILRIDGEWLVDLKSILKM
ncbi:MAG: DUF4878 domain-containing protein [Chitinophagaceae bacterium]|nr:MAG: DUF4878 domain-containing protein [Chitinophagaceae bacterium]